MAPPHLILVFLALISTALGDYHFTHPVGGAVISDTTLLVKWNEGPTAPTISETVEWSLGICTGGDTDDTIYQVSSTDVGYGGPPATGGVTSIDFDPTSGGRMHNAYFICMQWQTNDSDITNYSERFSLTAMTGTFLPQVVKAIKSVDGAWTAPPRNYTGPSLTPPTSKPKGSRTPGVTLSAAVGAVIGIGGLLVLMASIAVVVLFLRRRRRHQAMTNPRTSKLMDSGAIQQLDGTPVNYIAKPPDASSYELHSPQEEPVSAVTYYSDNSMYSSVLRHQQQPAPAYELPSRGSKAYELGT